VSAVVPVLTRLKLGQIVFVEAAVFALKNCTLTPSAAKLVDIGSMITIIMKAISRRALVFFILIFSSL
jgi:hypothetical protein